MNPLLESVRTMQGDFGRNFTDREGASLLKTRIEAYWHERGADVQVMLVEAPFSPAIRSARFDIRSELVNGQPRAPSK